MDSDPSIKSKIFEQDNLIEEEVYTFIDSFFL